MNEQAKRIEKQMVQIVLTQSFFATLLLRMKIEENNAAGPTMCTDGEHIYWNADFVKSISDDEIRAVLVHEVLHPALGHLWRIGGRDMQKWNIATDFQINDFIEAVNEEA